MSEKQITSLCNRHGKTHLYNEVDCPWCEIDRLKADNTLKHREIRESAIRHEAFATGVVYALARLVEMHDQPSIAVDILRESSIDVRMAAEYDVEFLRRSIPELPKGRE